MEHKFNRTIEELEQVASMFWPEELSKKEATLSIIPKLLETQDQFTSILAIKVKNLEKVFEIISASELSGNLFLKHLCILSDVGGEMLQRFNSQFDALFPNKEMRYLWGEEEFTYLFKELPLSGSLTNTRLGLSSKKLFIEQPLKDLHKDVIALLLLGAASTDEDVANVLAKCEISDYLGMPEELDRFIRQRYIWVSRITGGSQANNLGQLAQKFVYEYLKDNLDVDGATLHGNGHIPGVTHTDEEEKGLTTFDVVVEKDSKYVAIEISFQVTTNSTIERKRGQAQSRYQQIEEGNHRIAYVIDGAGNFQRRSAISTICSYSHCTVALSEEELSILCQFIEQYFNA